ncbi:LLM class flavin-dependent oxidoreductase [Chondromyces apiculatus]|uniref:Luciferase-like monooxygenase n=1 Tax=Chondromyces apiculatus DSM 436 TaxID=1192034 RepID=A0A017T393_9BACT|nr:LLM class flavin-dependent oxidoreductase [Chondromyces apiculatus]EYF03719.1 putative monooxygenase with luciferase-like ATPase activity [Chondromyces apiculatus DSM 436]
MPLPLSVLDLFPVGHATTPSQAIRDSISLARRIDTLGYRRYWIAEHHNMPNIASAAPEILIGHVASVTKRMRVGSGGIMIPNHSPLRVVEIFRTLEALHPGRIDLGLGRAPGTDQVTAAALRRGGAEVNQDLAELFAFANGTFPVGHPFATIVAQPSDTPLPPIWMLGSTDGGARIAAAQGLPYAFAGHFSMAEAKSAIALYRERFRPSKTLAAPQVMLAVTVICADTDARANELAAPHRVAIARLTRGRPTPFPSIEEALAYRFTPEEQATIDRFSLGSILGTPARVREGLLRLAEETTADELMISTMISPIEERIASYERIASLFDLPTS